LAFALPIIQGILDQKNASEKTPKIGPKALVLTPTRELAIQIKNHINCVIKQLPLKVTTKIQLKY